MKLPQIKNPFSAKSADLDTREMLLELMRRQRKLNAALVIAVVSLSLAFSALLPLKEVTPQVVHVNTSSGEVYVPRQQAMGTFKPSQDNTNYFIRRWIKDVFTIQPSLTVNVYEPRALSMLRGNNVIGQFKALRVADKTFERIARDPTLIRDVTIASFNQVAGTERAVVANLVLKTVTGGEITEERKSLTIFFEQFPPKTPRDREENPLGLFVVDFKVADSK